MTHVTGHILDLEHLEYFESESDTKIFYRSYNVSKKDFDQASSSYYLN